MTVSGAILAGGKSSRMGQNKALMQLGDKFVIEHIAKEMRKLDGRLLLVANDKTAFSFLGLPIAADRYQEKGPLAGLEAALSNLPEGYIALAACDTPFLSAGVYRYLVDRADGKQAVIPVYQDRRHPLSGIYHTSILPQVRECLENGELKIQLLLDRLDYRLETDFSGMAGDTLEKHFFNMNNPEEYVQAVKFIEK